MQKLDTKIKSYFGLNSKREDFGIELEMEFNEPTRIIDLKLFTNLSWRVERDDSLRGNSIEVISPRLTEKSFKEAEGELRLLEDITKRTFIRSARAGFHLHRNILKNWTYRNFINFMGAYWILEPLILASVDRLRKRNPFCTSLEIAEENFDLVHLFLKHDQIPPANTSKYSALNISNIAGFGTIEFRFMESTNKFEEIKQWKDFLVNLTDTLSKIDLKEFCSQFLTSKKTYLNKFLPDWLLKDIKTNDYNYSELEESVLNGHYFANKLLEDFILTQEETYYITNDEESTKKKPAKWIIDDNGGVVVNAGFNIEDEQRRAMETLLRDREGRNRTREPR